jgi:hypothetical protein
MLLPILTVNLLSLEFDLGYIGYHFRVWAELYGTHSSVQVSVGIAGAVSTFGLNAAVVRFLAPCWEG